eukprot:11618743-Alexandrium_andersonii.AAC.1
MTALVSEWPRLPSRVGKRSAFMPPPEAPEGVGAGAACSAARLEWLRSATPYSRARKISTQMFQNIKIKK